MDTRRSRSPAGGTRSLRRSCWGAIHRGKTSVPASVRELRRCRGQFDVAHAFTAADVYAALRWGGGPVVFGVAEVLGRDRLANRRQRLALLGRAIQDSAAVVATGEEQQAALRLAGLPSTRRCSRRRTPRDMRCCTRR